jgi:hypothetical protein
MFKKNKQSGGDGYVVNVNESIGGLPAYSRYSNNYRPIFEGQLLQNGGKSKKNKQSGGDGYVVNVNEGIGGLPAYSRYSNNYRPIFDGELLQNGGYINGSPVIPALDLEVNTEVSRTIYENDLYLQDGSGDCECNKQDTSVFDLIKKQQGGSAEKLSQFNAIRELSISLTPLSLNSLLKIVITIFLNFFSEKKPRVSKQLGGYVNELENILAPLGKNNLLVLSGLLLLHYFAVEKNKKHNKFVGGNNIMGNLSNILAPIGLNPLGTSVILVLLQQAFSNMKKNNNSSQKGGNPLKNLIAPLGTNAFIATGLLVIIEKLFMSKYKEIKATKKNIKLSGGNIEKNYETLFNLIAPITFNTFAKKSFLDNMAEKNLIKNKSNKKK